MAGSLHVVDWIILLAYVAAILAFGVWIGRGQRGAVDYFLGGRGIPGWAVLLSIVATETSTVTFLSVPGITFAQQGDFRFLQLTFGYILGRLAVVVFLLPHYFRGELFTVYELLGQRFGVVPRRLSSLLFIVTRTLADGLRLYLTALVLRSVLDIDLVLCVAIMGTATVAYTFLGGVRSVIWNDCIQFTVYMLGAAVAAWVLLDRLPDGLPGLLEYARQNDKFRLLDFDTSLTAKTITFWSGLIGGAFLSFASHGADQLMVQRYLAARSQRQAAFALATSGFVVCLQFALFLSIGVGLASYFATFPPSRPLRNDEAFVAFIIANVPVGLVGIILAAVFSAAMSTLSSSLNSSAAALVSDFCMAGGNAGSDPVRALWLGRAATVLFGVAQMVVATATDRLALDSGVVSAVLAIAGFTTGPILGLFLLALMVRKTSSDTAAIALMAGLGAAAVVTFDTPTSWPWYTVVGTSTTLLVGLADHFATRDKTNR